MNSDIAWVLVSLGTQVQSQYSIQTTFHTTFPFLMAMISQTKQARLLKNVFIDVIEVARFTVSIDVGTKPGMKLFKKLDARSIQSFFLFFSWTLDVSRTGSYEITLACLSVRLSVRPSLNFLKIESLVFF